jgi:hypothetical protein
MRFQRFVNCVNQLADLMNLDVDGTFVKNRVHNDFPISLGVDIQHSPIALISTITHRLASA